MHVRIAWEIYHHQQRAKATSDRPKTSSTSASSTASKGIPGSIGLSGNGSNSSKSNTSQTSTSTSSSVASRVDLFRAPNMFPGMSRAGEIGPPPFPSPLLSHGHSPMPRTSQFDPSMFLASSAAHLGKC